MADSFIHLPGRIVGSEAHLPANLKAFVAVRRIARPRRSGVALLAFWGVLLLNEARGAYLVQELWRSLFG
jgi:hypothetical protein